MAMAMTSILRRPITGKAAAAVRISKQIGGGASTFTSTSSRRQKSCRLSAVSVGGVGRGGQQQGHHPSSHRIFDHHHRRRTPAAAATWRQRIVDPLPQQRFFARCLSASSTPGRKEEDPPPSSSAAAAAAAAVTDEKNDRTDESASSSASSSAAALEPSESDGGDPPPAAVAAAADKNKNEIEQNASSAANPSDEEVAEEEDKEEEEEGPSSATTRHDDFPWRHSPSPTQRILEKDDYSHMPNNFQARFVRRVVACKELNLTPWDAVPLPFGISHEWEEELAGNFATAFGLALEELLARAFDGRVEVTVDEEHGVSIDSSVRKEVVVEGEEGGVTSDDDRYLRDMFDEKLLERYPTLDPDKFHLKLSVRPIEATLQHIFAVPLITRDIVASKPHLKGSYQRIEREFAESKSYDTVKKMTYDLADEIGEDDAYRRTVIADALITCSEFYQARDPSTGLVVRGTEDGSEEEEEEIVVHSVRFEAKTEKDEDGNRRIAGSWKIVDLDDLLEGNVFY